VAEFVLELEPLIGDIISPSEPILRRIPSVSLKCVPIFVTGARRKTFAILG
jgi:hypothetical protein